MPRARVTPHGPLHEGKCRGDIDRERTGETGIPRAIGLRPASFDPRRTDQTILRWRTFSASPESRWHAPARGRQVRSSGARQARRNRTTSAAANLRCVTQPRGQPHSRSALQAP